MKKTLVTIFALSAMSSAAVANQFFPESINRTYNVQLSNLPEMNRHSIEITLPNTATTVDKLQFCNSLNAENSSLGSSLNMTDRAGVRYFGATSFYENRGTEIKGSCIFYLPANMRDSEWSIPIRYKGTTNIYNIAYKDIDVISARQVKNNITTPLTSSLKFAKNDEVNLVFEKSYSDLQLDNKLPEGLEVFKSTDTLRILGKAQQTGVYSFSIIDLNSDNKEINFSLDIKETEPEPEQPQPCKVSSVYVPEGQRIIFRYSMKRVDSDC